MYLCCACSVNFSFQPSVIIALASELCRWDGAVRGHACIGPGSPSQPALEKGTHVTEQMAQRSVVPLFLRLSQDPYAFVKQTQTYCRCRFSCREASCVATASLLLPASPLRHPAGPGSIAQAGVLPFSLDFCQNKVTLYLPCKSYEPIFDFNIFWVFIKVVSDHATCLEVVRQFGFSEVEGDDLMRCGT